MTVQPGGPAPTGKHVQPGPVSTAVGEAMTADGQKFVILQIDHTTGTGVYALDPAHAEKLGADLTAQAQRTKSGLFVPSPAGLLNPIVPPSATAKG